MALQNFIAKSLPAISAAWLNVVDALKFTVFADATTKAAARTALTSDTPLEVVNGGTNSRTGVGLIMYGTDSGAANAYVIAVSTPIPAILTAGALVMFTAVNANTGPSTVNVGGTGGIAIINQAGGALTGGEILTTGPTWLQYTGAAWQIVGTGAELGNVRTVTEIAASALPTNYAYLPVPENISRFSAVDTGTDVAVNIQNTINALNGGAIKGGSVLVPGDANSIFGISATLTFPKRATGTSNFSDAYQLRGTSRVGPTIKAITGLGANAMIDMSGTSATVLNYYRDVSDLKLDGNSIALYGIDFSFVQHGNIERTFVNNLAGAASAAYRLNSTITSTFYATKAHNNAGHGWLADGGSVNFVNACTWLGGGVLSCAGDGFHFTGGISGCTWLGFNYESCGGYGFWSAGYSSGANLIDGGYAELNVLGDFYFGALTYQESMFVKGLYVNGYTAGTSDAAYTPFRFKFADGCVIEYIRVNQPVKSPNGYYFSDMNIAGGNVLNCILRGCTVGFLANPLAATTPPNQIHNLPQTWVNQGNAVVDDPAFFPLIQNNVLKGRFPYGGWTLSQGGAGTAQRGADLGGAPAIELNRPASGDTAQISQVITITPEMANRFVVFAVPIKDLAGNKQYQVNITPNGTSPQLGTITVSTLAVNTETICYVLAFAPADCTTLSLSVVALQAGCDALIGHPCLYVGAAPWYSSAGDQYWYASAAPTVGTWKVGDIVFNSASAVGQPKGWTCTSASPLTFVSQGNL